MVGREPCIFNGQKKIDGGVDDSAADADNFASGRMN
jgi:hypothetical protein